jgi:hypothetical protein
MTSTTSCEPRAIHLADQLPAAALMAFCLKIARAYVSVAKLAPSQSSWPHALFRNRKSTPILAMRLQRRFWI